MSVAVDPNAAVNALAARFWDGILERDPMWATILGDERFNDRWPDLGPEGRAADDAAYRSTLAEASDIPPDGLEPEQYQLAIDHMPGPQVWPAEMAQYQPGDTPERVEMLLTRYARYPEMVEQYVSTLDEGIGDGRTSAIT